MIARSKIVGAQLLEGEALPRAPADQLIIMLFAHESNVDCFVRRAQGLFVWNHARADWLAIRKSFPI